MSTSITALPITPNEVFEIEPGEWLRTVQRMAVTPTPACYESLVRLQTCHALDHHYEPVILEPPEEAEDDFWAAVDAATPAAEHLSTIYPIGGRLVLSPSPEELRVIAKGTKNPKLREVLFAKADVDEHLADPDRVRWPAPLMDIDPETSAAWDALQAVHALEVVELKLGVRHTDWTALLRGERPIESWVLPDLVPTGRQVALWSPAKQGKSLIVFDAAVAAALGRPILGGDVLDEPLDILYVDAEMTEDDIYQRLKEMGYTLEDAAALQAHFHYYQLQSWDPFDSATGGAEIAEIAEAAHARLVVVDTMSRMVRGEENSADTYRNFYQQTGLRLKQLGMALLRLDHSGKDIGQGQRGSSAKADDVDVVFRLTYNVARWLVTLERTHTRVPWVPERLTYRRELNPLRHVKVTTALGGTVVAESTRKRRDKIVEAVAAAGRLERRAIQSGVGSTTMTEDLAALVDEGRLEKVGHGMYQVPEDRLPGVG